MSDVNQARDLLDQAARLKSRFLLFVAASVLLDAAAVGAYIALQKPLALIGFVPGVLLVVIGVLQLKQSQQLTAEARRLRGASRG
jgi:hypothetical protein